MATKCCCGGVSHDVVVVVVIAGGRSSRRLVFFYLDGVLFSGGSLTMASSYGAVEQESDEMKVEGGTEVDVTHL